MTETAPPLLAVVLKGRCPRCGVGPLFQRVLEIRERCDHCGLDLRGSDTGDGAAVPVVLVLGAIIVTLAFIVEFRLNPPLWVHAIVWPLVSVPLAVLMIRPFKAFLAAQQYRHRASEMDL